MEWTPEALKAEIDYRQAALREDAERARVEREDGTPRHPWWWWLVHRRAPRVPLPGNGHHDAA
ncbi:hypothetical protein [Saccharothrix australiensis]|uniref:Uncharacterized protein n=1 Tax=Saccharothrix australiensis TaxID=2072 RepID=A0A495W5R9_9PSEU|nr:hypothetical protein [Saccharothrix australiensis]RKT56789.1 hypothetical protein C8E97_5501 [Saccharothrix australiensis]